MSNLIVKFNGAQIPYAVVEGKYFIPIHPICHALKLDGKHHVRSLKIDPILGGEVCVHTLLDSNSHRQKMACLPERLIYFWLASIKETNTMSEQTKLNLRRYKIECCNVLYEHFHGRLIKRVQLLTNNSALNQEIKELESLVENSSISKQIELLLQEKRSSKEYIRLEELKKQRSVNRSNLTKLDTAVSQQLSLFDD